MVLVELALMRTAMSPTSLAILLVMSMKSRLCFTILSSAAWYGWAMS
jgi:hypothetical protein